jgi:fatty-acyl-CoA synthase
LSLSSSHLWSNAGRPRSEFDLRALRTGVMAGSPCPIEVMKRLISDMNLREMTICYGMTETSPVSTQARGSGRQTGRRGFTSITSEQ